MPRWQWIKTMLPLSRIPYWFPEQQNSPWSHCKSGQHLFWQYLNGIYNQLSRSVNQPKLKRKWYRCQTFDHARWKALWIFYVETLWVGRKRKRAYLQSLCAKLTISRQRYKLLAICYTRQQGVVLLFMMAYTTYNVYISSLEKVTKTYWKINGLACYRGS